MQSTLKTKKEKTHTASSTTPSHHKKLLVLTPIHQKHSQLLFAKQAITPPQHISESNTYCAKSTPTVQSSSKRQKYSAKTRSLARLEENNSAEAKKLISISSQEKDLTTSSKRDQISASPSLTVRKPSQTRHGHARARRRTKSAPSNHTNSVRRVETTVLRHDDISINDSETKASASPEKDSTVNADCTNSKMLNKDNTTKAGSRAQTRGAKKRKRIRLREFSLSPTPDPVSPVPPLPDCNSANELAADTPRKLPFNTNFVNPGEMLESSSFLETGPDIFGEPACRVRIL